MLHYLKEVRVTTSLKRVLFKSFDNADKMYYILLEDSLILLDIWVYLNMVLQ